MCYLLNVPLWRNGLVVKAMDSQSRGPVSLSYHLKFSKGCLPKILLGPFLNTLTQLTPVYLWEFSSFNSKDLSDSHAWFGNVHNGWTSFFHATLENLMMIIYFRSTLLHSVTCCFYFSFDFHSLLFVQFLMLVHRAYTRCLGQTLSLTYIVRTC